MQKKRKSKIINGGTAPDVREDSIFQVVKLDEVIHGGEAPDKADEEIFKKVPQKNILPIFYILLTLLIILAVAPIAYNIMALIILPGPEKDIVLSKSLEK